MRKTLLIAALGILAACSAPVEKGAKDAFAEHFYHRDMRGSIPSPGNKYMLYLTSFSPVDKTVEIVCERNMPWDLF
jgi:hypothetical protein